MSGEGSGKPPETLVGYFLCTNIISSSSNLVKNLIVFEHPVEWLIKQYPGSVTILWWTHITATVDDYIRWSKSTHVEPVPPLQVRGQEQIHS